MVSRIALAWLVAALGLVGGLPGGAAGQGSAPVATLADGRVGQIHFESRTPAGYFALVRREATPGAVVVGTLRLPKDAAGRVPAMVIAHGSGGVDVREAAWADRLGAIGLATFVVDSFTPRNIRETATDQGRLPTAANVADALTALRLLATHPRIDPDRIGVIGFSKGGQVALYTALEPFRRGVLDDERRFAAHVALYPYCSDWYTAARVTGAPLLLLLGAATTTRPRRPVAATRSGSRARGRRPPSSPTRMPTTTSTRSGGRASSAGSSPGAAATWRWTWITSRSRVGGPGRTSPPPRAGPDATAWPAGPPSAETPRRGAGPRRTSRPSCAACSSPRRVDGLRAVCYGCRANRFSHSSRTTRSGRWQWRKKRTIRNRVGCRGARCSAAWALRLAPRSWPRASRARRPRRWGRPAPSPSRPATSARAGRPPRTSPIPTCSPCSRPSTGSGSPTRRSSACGRARSGRRGPRGTRRAAISCGATSQTTASSGGSRTTGTSACSACRRTTATATPSISRGGSSRASTSPGAWCATSWTAR